MGYLQGRGLKSRMGRGRIHHRDREEESRKESLSALTQPSQQSSSVQHPRQKQQPNSKQCWGNPAKKEGFGLHLEGTKSGPYSVRVNLVIHTGLDEPKDQCLKSSCCTWFLTYTILEQRWVLTTVPIPHQIKVHSSTLVIQTFIPFPSTHVHMPHVLDIGLDSFVITKKKIMLWMFCLFSHVFLKDNFI